MHHIAGQGLDGVVGIGRAVTVTVSAGVQRNHVVPLVSQDLTGFLPGKAVLPATMQHEDRRPAGRLGTTVPFVADQGDVDRSVVVREQCAGDDFARRVDPAHGVDGDARAFGGALHVRSRSAPGRAGHRSKDTQYSMPV